MIKPKILATEIGQERMCLNEGIREQVCMLAWRAGIRENIMSGRIKRERMLGGKKSLLSLLNS